MEYKDQEIINRIQEVMKEKGLTTQTEMEAALGKSQSTISAVFKLKRSALPIINALNEKYQISKQWLLSGTGMKYLLTEDKSNSIKSNNLQMTNDERVELIRQLNDLYTRHQSIMSEEQEIMKSIVEINKKLLLAGVDIAGI